MAMNATCDNTVAHDDSVIHQFCEGCDFETYSASEPNSVERADFHKSLMGHNHQMFLCGDGKQY